MRDKAKTILIIVCVLATVGGIVWYLTQSKYSLTTTSPIKTPVEVTQSFYKWYLEFKGHPLLSEAYKESEYLGTRSKETLGRLVKEKGTALVDSDPILCSDGAPYSYEVEEITATEAGAKTKVVADYYGDIVEIEVGLTKEGRLWVINDITCPQRLDED